jgi:hypothetical protein
VDVPIPARFVLSESDDDVVERFVATATGTLDRFEEVTGEFEPYRSWVAGQRDAFVAETGAVLRAVRRPALPGGPVNRPKRDRRKR